MTLSASLIQSQLTQGELYLFDELDSTNEYLVTHCKNLPKGSICIAKTQTAGRGRRGRNWVAPVGNLNYSLSWHYPRKVHLVLPPLSLIVGLMVIESLQQQGVKDLSIKWPNDIYHQGKKAGGILIELNTTPSHLHLVMGIGLNLAPINESSIDQPVSDLSQYQVDLNQLIIYLTAKLQKMLTDYPQTGFQPYYAMWQSYDLFFQQEVSVITESLVYSGISQGINEQGELLLQQQNQIKHFAIGEVSLRKV
ncbi:Bifunctional protein BirA [Phocoenobacter uteri]|uniref:biotin--[biotin carboxyl-carrier protein] ligase n=1 Tax=Phocoenobacter uteri TaxID=146806 RepID=A0A379CBP2_9PAST|nr:biotin--[acetyl-CoA-carboxylase] ligase [Phocoenobacter uteri]MDG6881667.1 biotin--[acetyl-CoA-carboxylase] ligase [Phocoenobacter uteri]SUB59701.1 Bifunctional protein BirA [Phocoenobacter uteri]